MTSMRERFLDVVADALDRDPRVAVVLAQIDVARLESRAGARRHPRRVINVGIREQLMISVAGGFALEGFRPVVESYAPFVVQRPFEQIKLDLGHQDAGAVLVSVGASYDASAEGRTHQAPEDVALLATLPGWTIHVPGHADEAERLLLRALEGDDRVYLRLSDETNAKPVHTDGLALHRRGGEGAPLVVAVGPTLDEAVLATADLDVTVAYLPTVRPFDAAGLRAAMSGTDVVLVEPYLAGTSASEVADALRERPHRLLSLGVRNAELRRYGSPAEHRAAHGLDARGIRAAFGEFRREDSRGRGGSKGSATKSIS
jgi:transketolase